MSDAELQEEEREVLSSIYDGDPAFRQLTATTFQYKYGDDGDPKTFLLEISWGETYPTEKPKINMDTFYNKHILPEVKAHIVSEIDKEAEQYLGAAMTYTLFEFVKERAQDLMSAQPESTVTSISSAVENISLADSQDSPVIKKVVKKEQLSKAQKRKQWDRVDAKGDRPRGWDWVDVVKHLSQSGPKQLETLAPSTGS
ncbi:RWD domain-containing protein 4 isoform X1 [Schistocerca nitens]|uniref:RWD domain-containing protein 4 isoform X1 n=1 Tax=Schistocerca nitens TaxID=7011 RepID=UPI0021191B5D|nr:RWD domain-containing protein 4 isoform X1 [Schistocerca nitens]